MASDLVVSLTIKAALGAGFQAAFGAAAKASEKLGDGLKKAGKEHFKIGEQMEKLAKKQADLMDKIDNSSNIGKKKLDRMHQQYAKMSASIDRLKQKQEQYTQAISKSEQAQKKLSDAIKRQEDLRQRRDAARTDLADAAATTYAIAKPLGKAVQTYMEGEDAETNLKIAMMKSDGTFGRFEGIKKKASKLAVDLPGNSKDFFGLATALRKQGLSDTVIEGGALETSAKLNVLLEMDQVQGGEFLAKFMEAHGLNEKDVGLGADYLQRAMFASGLSKDQIYESMSYYASTANSLGLTGLENTKKLLAIEGMAGQKGLEGSSFGTGLNMFLSRLNKGPKMIEAASKGMKAEARKMMEESGVQFEFFDKKGTLKTIDGVMGELEKLDIIRQKFGDEGAMLVAEEMFGIESARLANILAQEGREGLAKQLAKMDEQASLQERINLKTATLSSVLESLGGVWSNAVGTIGSAFADDLKNLASIANDFIDNSLQPLLENNKGLVKVLGVSALALSGLVTIGLAAKFVFFGLASAWGAVTMPFKAFQALKAAHTLAVLNGQTTMLTRTVGVFGRAFAWVKTLSFGKLFGFLKSIPLNPLKALPMLFGAAKVAIFSVFGALKGFAVVAAPLLFKIGLIAGAVFLIYKFWNPLKAFFAGIWDSIKAAAAPIMPIFESIGNAIQPALDWLGQFFNLTQVGEGNARSLGQTVGGVLVAAFMGLTAPMRLVWSVAKWLWDGLSGLFSGEISIGDIFAGIKRKFEEFVNKIKEWKDKAVKLWDDFWSSFKSKDTPSAGAGGGGDGGGFWSSLVGGFESAKTKISETAGGLWDSAKAKFDEAKGTLTTKAGEIWSSVTNVLNGANGVNIGAIIAQTVNGAVSAISGAATTISGVLSAMVQGMSGAFVAIFPVISTAFSGMASVASAGMASLNTVVTAGFVVMRVQVASGWQSLGAAMSGNPMLARLQMAMGQCIGYLGSVQGRFYAIGLNISQGLARGMQAGLAQIRATAASIAQEIQKTTRLQMQIKSPSRVMMAIGRDVVAGLDVGMGKQFVPTLKSYQDNLSTLSDPVSSPVLSPLDIRPIKARQGGVGAGEMVIHFNPTINANGSASRDDIHQAVAMSLKEFEKMMKRVEDARRRRAYV